MLYLWIKQFFANLLSGGLNNFLPSLYYWASYSSYSNVVLLSSSQLFWIPNDILKSRYSVTPLPSNYYWLTWWRNKSGHPSDLYHWASFPEYFNNILKLGLCHWINCSGSPDDILKVTACHLASNSGQYWGQSWLPHKGGALIAFNQQLWLLYHVLQQSKMTNYMLQ